ncbi:MAG: Ig-like domain-containing protein [Ginsengibacter sp.]
MVGNSCAQVGMPTGGPRDSIPPTLIKSSPPIRTTHFSGNRITLTFDEYVHVENVQQNLLVSPTPRVNPNVDYKFREVTIKLRDTLLPNTTYSIQLGNAIQDVNENNPYPNFTYVFSTGSYIDSLTLNGKVIVAETGLPDSTLIAELYNDLSDSVVFKTKPKYVSRIDKEGNYNFSYLAAGTYQLFALRDESGTKLYNNPKQLFAFADSTIVINKENKTAPVLYAYSEEKETPTTSTSKQEKFLKFSTSIINAHQDLLTPLEINFNHPLKNSAAAFANIKDTLFNNIATKISTDTLGKKYKIEFNAKPSQKYLLVINKELAIDTAGVALLKNDTIPFTMKNESEYGSIRLNFTNLQKFKHPVLQFVSRNEIVASFELPSAIFEQKLVAPGEYTLRILDDENGNKAWDPGHYSPQKKNLQKQPEKIYNISQSLNIKANWDNIRDIVL